MHKEEMIPAAYGGRFTLPIACLNEYEYYRSMSPSCAVHLSTHPHPKRAGKRGCWESERRERRTENVPRLVVNTTNTGTARADAVRRYYDFSVVVADVL